MYSFYFWVLEEFRLTISGLESYYVPSVNPIMGWEIVVYDPVLAESRLGGNKAELVGQSKDFGVENVVENLSFYEFVVEDAEDSDENEPTLRFKRTVLTTPQTMTKPTLKCQRKTTTPPNVPLIAPLPQPQTQSSGPPIGLPLPENRVESPVKKKKSTLKSTKTPSEHTPNQLYPRNMRKMGSLGTSVRTS